MDGINGIFSSFIIIETFIIGSIALYSWRRRTVAGALPLFLLCIASSFYSLGYSMELMSCSLAEVNFWSKFQYIGLPFIPVLCLALAKTMTDKSGNDHIKLLLAVAIPGAITAFMRFTSEAHHLFYGNMQLVTNGYFKILQFEKGPWYYLHFVYFILCASYAIGLYIKAFRTASAPHKKQLIILIIASVVPFISIGINLLNVFPYQMDSGPFFIFLDYLLFSYGIFRYNMLYLIPLSRDRVFEWMHDGVLVLDLTHRLIDFNQAASCIFPELHENKSGAALQNTLKDYPDFIKLFEQWQAVTNTPCSTDDNALVPQEYEFELTKGISQEKLCYHVRYKELNIKGRVIGTIVMLTNITKAKALMQKLEKTAQLDGLTQINNRRHFIELTDIQIKRIERHSGNGVLVLFDLDHFKNVNDQFGHQAGDFVLKAVAQKTLHILREIDILGRYGGEEFILFLPDTELEQAEIVMERIRSAFDNEPFLWCEQPIQVTASFGMTALYGTSNAVSHKDFDTMVKAADEAMYKAKALGRNRIESI